MSEHTARIRWHRGSSDFTYETYSRDHIWAFDNGVDIKASAAPGYQGSDSAIDPEEAFVAALSSCHMLTFLAIAAKKQIVVEEYIDEAVGVLEKNADGKLSVTRVVLRPVVKFGHDSAQDQAQLEKLHDSAHRNCFIANSVNTDVSVDV